MRHCYLLLMEAKQLEEYKGWQVTAVYMEGKNGGFVPRVSVLKQRDSYTEEANREFDSRASADQWCLRTAHDRIDSVERTGGDQIS